jgi:hypothetical protein
MAFKHLYGSNKYFNLAQSETILAQSETILAPPEIILVLCLAPPLI